MAPNPEPGWHIYKEQMAFWCHGDALWQPAPTHHYQRISIGDVGFVRCGQFHLLFSAGRALGERQLGIDVPHTFVELQPNATVTAFSQPRSSGCLHTDTVREIGVGVGASVSTPLPLEPGAYFSYELTGKRGAALVTRYQTYKEDALKRSAFEQYTKKHYDSWVAFSREKQYGDDVKPVLVYGVDMTKDFAMAAYSSEGTSLAADLTISVPTLASASASIWGTWRTRGSAHTNHGPQQCVPPSSTQAIDPPSQSTRVGIVSDDYNQCVFIRYYTMRRRMGFYPMVMRAAAGPRDLGSGDNRGDTFPELIARQHPAAADAGSDQDIVIHNTPYDDEFDEFNVIADYVFQNSNATSVLTHHQDLVEIRAAGGSGDILSLLRTKRPRIVVEESGVGRIICEENRLLVDEGDFSQHVRSALGVASRDYPSYNRDFNRQDMNPPSTRSNQDGPPPHILARSSQTPILDELPTATSFKERGRKQTCPNFSQVVSGALTKLAAEGGTRLSSLDTIISRSGDGSLDIQLGNEEVETLVETLDKLVREIRDREVRDCCLLILAEVCRANIILPRSYIVSNVVRGEKWKIGRFADIWKGKVGTEDVCIKVFRMHEARKQAKIKGAFYYHVIGWKRVSHDNVLPFLGVSTILRPFCLISPLMPNGDIIDYTTKNRDANRLLLLTNVACGLEYLHSLDIVHGGVNPGNILITAKNEACIGSFGIAGVMTDPLITEQRGTTACRQGTLRYMAPEQVNPSMFKLENGNAMKATDVHSFAMTAYEVLTGIKPYPGIEQLGPLVTGIIGGTRPPRPEDEAMARLLPNEIWKVMESSWTPKPLSRPTIDEVHRVFLRSVTRADGPTPKGGETGVILGRGFLGKVRDLFLHHS